jgi:O-acetylserine/cysteine efflux transporter
MKAIVLALCAGVCWGVGEVCTRSVLHSGKIGPLTALLVRSFVALPIILLVWFIARDGVGGSEPESREYLSADAATWTKLVLGSGVLAGAAALICFYFALKFGPISQVKPIAFCVAPAIAVILGCTLLGETMDARKAIGVVLVLAGVVVLTPARAGG